MLFVFIANLIVETTGPPLIILAIPPLRGRQKMLQLAMRYAPLPAIVVTIVLVARAAVGIVAVVQAVPDNIALSLPVVAIITPVIAVVAIIARPIVMMMVMMFVAGESSGRDEEQCAEEQSKESESFHIYS